MTLQPDWEAIAAVGSAARAILNTVAFDAVLFTLAFWIWRKAGKL